jgi:hypothetical protein
MRIDPRVGAFCVALIVRVSDQRDILCLPVSNNHLADERF